MRKLLLVLLVLWIAPVSTAGAQVFDTIEDVESYLASETIGEDQQVFIVRSLYPFTVDLEFHATDSGGAWPGNGEVYSLNNNRWNVFILSCSPGENICYGAGARNRYDLYWGIGVDGSLGCSECCYKCAGGTSRAIILK